MRRAAIVIAASLGAVALLWLVIVARTSTEVVSAYRLTDPATIILETMGPPRGWTRFTNVVESTSEVRVKVESWNWLPGPGAAYAVRVELTIHLAEPLADRTVLDASGYQPVRDDGQATVQ